MHRRRQVTFVAIVATILFSTSLCAADDQSISKWKGEAEIGYLSTSGNTDTETLNAKVKIIHEVEKWKNTLIAETTKSLDSGTVNAQRSFISGKTDYKFSKKSYLFGLLTYEDDRFSGYDYQASIVAGYGRKLINADTLKWDGEIGLGNKRSELDSGDSDSENIIYVGTEVDWKISKTASFNEKLTVEAGEDVTTTKSVTSLKAKINSKLASKITYTIKHVSEVPVDVEKTDKELAVTLVYNF